MSLLYKLTREDHTSGNPCYGKGFEMDYSKVLKWGPGITHKLTQPEPTSRYFWLCTATHLHAYETLELATLMKLASVSSAFTVVWEAEGEIKQKEYGKVGVFELTTTKLSDKPLLDFTKEKKDLVIAEIDRLDRAGAKALDTAVSGVCYEATGTPVSYCREQYEWYAKNEPLGLHSHQKTVEDYILSQKLYSFSRKKTYDDLKEYAHKLFHG